MDGFLHDCSVVEACYLSSVHGNYIRRHAKVEKPVEVFIGIRSVGDVCLERCFEIMNWARLNQLLVLTETVIRAELAITSHEEPCETASANTTRNLASA